MKRMASAVMILVCFLSVACGAYAASLQKGETVIIRSNLRVQGGVIAFHNMSSLPGMIPAGTEVKIIKSSGGKTVFVDLANHKEYTLIANAAQWDKYFVKSRSEISGAVKGEVMVGMTKDEVYAAKGCPAFIAWGVKSDAHPFDNIMKSDTWYYLKTTRGHDKLIKFANAAVVSIDSY